jgi:hypothetical protein
MLDGGGSAPPERVLGVMLGRYVRDYFNNPGILLLNLHSADSNSALPCQSFSVEVCWKAAGRGVRSSVSQRVSTREARRVDFNGHSATLCHSHTTSPLDHITETSRDFHASCTQKISAIPPFFFFQAVLIRQIYISTRQLERKPHPQCKTPWNATVFI